MEGNYAAAKASRSGELFYFVILHVKLLRTGPMQKLGSCEAWLCIRFFLHAALQEASSSPSIMVYALPWGSKSILNNCIPKVAINCNIYVYTEKERACAGTNIWSPRGRFPLRSTSPLVDCMLMILRRPRMAMLKEILRRTAAGSDSV